MLLDQSKNIKVWLSLAWFEIDNAENYVNSRGIFEKALDHFKSNEPELKEERVMLLENWSKLEQAFGTQ